MFFKPKWQHQNKEVRAKAISKIKNDKNKLFKVIKSKADLGVIKEVLDSIEDSSIFEKLLFFETNDFLKKNPTRLEKIEDFILAKINNRFFFITQFENKFHSYEWRLKFFKRYVECSGLDESNFHHDFLKPEYYIYATEDIAKILSKDRDLSLFIDRLRVLHYQEHYNAFFTAFNKISDENLKISLSKEIFNENSFENTNTLLPQDDERVVNIKKMLTNTLYNIFKKSSSRYLEHVMSFSNNNTFEILQMKLYCSTLRKSELRELFDSNNLLGNNLLSYVIDRIDEISRIEEDEILKLLIETEENSFHLASGVISIILRHMNEDIVTVRIISEIKKSSFLLKSEKFWAQVDKEHVIKFDLKNDFIDYIDGLGSGSVTIFYELLDGLSIKYDYEIIYGSGKCGVCDGYGELPQHTDVGMGMEDCSSCGGTGRSSSSHSIIRVVK